MGGVEGVEAHVAGDAAGTADAGEIVRDGTDLKTGLPVISLYGENKKPSFKDGMDSGINNPPSSAKPFITACLKVTNSDLFLLFVL